MILFSINLNCLYGKFHELRYRVENLKNKFILHFEYDGQKEESELQIKR